MFDNTNPDFIPDIHFVMLECLQIRLRTHFQIQIFIPMNFQWIGDLYFTDFEVYSLSPYIYMGNPYQSQRVLVKVGPGCWIPLQVS